MKQNVLILLVALVVAGCSIYHPHAVDIPLLEESGETRVDVAASLSTSVVPDNVSLNGTVSHAFTDEWAGQAHFNFGTGTYYAQLAPGYYYPLSSKTIAEVYVGVGYGKYLSRTGYSHDDMGNLISNYTSEGQYGILFAQGNIGWRHVGPLEFALALKAGCLLPQFQYIENDPNNNDAVIRQENYSHANLLIEPQMQMRLGGPHVKLSVKLGLCWLSHLDRGGLWSSGASDVFIHDIFTMGVGLHFSY